MSEIIYTPVVSLPIGDRQTSFTFYGDGLDFDPIGEPTEDGIPEPLQIAHNDGVRLVLVPTGGFDWVIGDHEVAEHGQSEYFLDLSAETDGAVDEVVEREKPHTKEMTDLLLSVLLFGFDYRSDTQTSTRRFGTPHGVIRNLRRGFIVTDHSRSRARSTTAETSSTTMPRWSKLRRGAGVSATSTRQMRFVCSLKRNPSGSGSSGVNLTDSPPRTRTGRPKRCHDGRVRPRTRQRRGHGVAGGKTSGSAIEMVFDHRDNHIRASA